MLGLSFNSEIRATGTAIQGELAYRHNVPLQLDDVELLYAALTPLEAGVARLLGEPVTPAGPLRADARRRRSPAATSSAPMGSGRPSRAGS